MRRLRILVLMHEDLVPPASLDGFSKKEISEWKTEYDVTVTLEDAGHEVRALGVGSDDTYLLVSIVAAWCVHAAYKVQVNLNKINALFYQISQNMIIFVGLSIFLHKLFCQFIS